MKIIVGLGNPGKKYDDTRHNIGFAYIECLAHKHNIKITKSECKALTGVGRIAGEQVVLAKPQTFMNLSGESVKSLSAKYKCSPEDIIVIFDDVSLSVGRMRIRLKGSAGGHNGIKSIIYNLSSEDFPRLKIGVGEKPFPEMDLADHVLGKFPKEDIKILTEMIPDVCTALELLIAGEASEAMNRFNQR